MSDAVVTPVRVAVTVTATRERAFEVFTRGMGSWWSFAGHSIYEAPGSDVVVEERVGGRVVERTPDGREGHWARVLVWNPPERLVLAWKPNPEAPDETEVEVTFTDAGGSTTVELVHRHWERLGAVAADRRAGYATGWVGLMDRFAAAAG
jgi:uncharacterized protein YndB with AHSA1/START domain